MDCNLKSILYLYTNRNARIQSLTHSHTVTPHPYTPAQTRITRIESFLAESSWVIPFMVTPSIKYSLCDFEALGLIPVCNTSAE